MTRLAILIAAFVLALPASAPAQGAGDDQYQDPFAEQTAQQDGGSDSGGGEQPVQDGLSEEPPIGGAGDSGSGSAGQTGEEPDQPAPQPGAAEEDQATGQLPNTGSDPRALVLCGLAFVLIGVGLRLRTIDPDAY